MIDIEFDFLFENGELIVEPIMVLPDQSDVENIAFELGDKFGGDAIITGTIDEDGNYKIASVDREDD